MHEIFLSCDWGTTNFRLRLVDRSTLAVIASTQSDEGVAMVLERWQKSAGKMNRVEFYQGVVQQHIKVLEQQTGRSLAGVPIVVSGMASSTIGMMELPYRQLPFFIADADLLYEHIEATAAFNHPIILVSGARTETDVMRGEETQLAGCTMDTEQDTQVFIFPGTHSKHITVEKGFATHFATYMTGEFFHLLANKSILANSVAANEALQEAGNKPAFSQGVLDGSRHNLLHQAFMVRTNSLFAHYNAAANYWYLSGLLIGTELRSIQQGQFTSITIVGAGALAETYQSALEVLGMQGVGIMDVQVALVRAHARMLDKVYKRPNK